MRRLHGVRYRLQRFRFRGALLWAAIFYSLTICLCANAQTRVDEAQVKAAMLYRFLSYIEWPASTADRDSAYVIAVLDAPAIAEELAEITEERTVNNREVRVVELTRLSRLEQPHLLFVGNGASGSIRRAASLSQARSIALITETEGALAKGSIINLELMEGRVGFEVSLKAAEQCGLKLSARLLAVATRVKKGDAQ